MINKEASENTGYVASVKILDVQKRYKPGPKHYVYVIQVTWSNPTNLFIIYRRYAQFFDLQCKLLDLFAETPVQVNDSTQPRQIPFLPGKIILGRSQIRQIALERKQALNIYCQTLILLTERISRSRPILEFFHPSATDVQKPIESIADEKKPLAISSLVISEPSKLATYRCLADFTATGKLEMSLKRNNIVQILQKHANGWWFVQHGDQTGFVPGTYLEPSELQRGAREGKTFEKSLNEMYIVNNRYDGKGQDELSLDQGSFVTVIEKSFTGWWTVKFNDVTGQFPALYLSTCKGRHTPENVLNYAANVISKIDKGNESNDSDWDDDEEYHTKASNQSKTELYYAHSSFKDDIGDCMSFQRGDVIEIHDKHASGWWYGRRLKGGNVLTWIPESFLQKEPIFDETVDNTSNHSFNSDHHSDMRDTVPSSPVLEQQEKKKEKIVTTTIYENLESQIPTKAVYAKVIKKPQPIPSPVAHRKSYISTPLSATSEDEESTARSVKELVKKFNRQ